MAILLAGLACLSASLLIAADKTRQIFALVGLRLHNRTGERERQTERQTDICSGRSSTSQQNWWEWKTGDIKTNLKLSIPKFHNASINAGRLCELLISYESVIRPVIRFRITVWMMWKMLVIASLFSVFMIANNLLAISYVMKILCHTRTFERTCEWHGIRNFSEKKRW